MIAGVNGFAIDGEALEPLRNKINSSVVMFNCGTTDLAAGEEVKLAGIKEDLEKAAELSRLSGGSLSVEVIGSADPTGTAEINSWISRARADKILGQLRERSEKLGSAKLTALGTGASVESACKVTFKVSN
jgi:outer membrane protein OmpA-like peptidoglycan-associated protein